MIHSQFFVDTSGLNLTRTRNPAQRSKTLYWQTAALLCNPFVSVVCLFLFFVFLLLFWLFMKKMTRQHRTWFIVRVTWEGDILEAALRTCQCQLHPVPSWYFKGHDNEKIYHILLTKWFMHIYAYLWGSNPIKRGGITLLRSILNVSQPKSSFSPKYATSICNESKYS